MKKKTLTFIFLIGILSILGNIFYNPTSTTIVEANKYLTPANPAFDDDNFYQCVRDNYHGSSSSDNLTDEELASITALNACGNKNISSVKGIEKLVSLKSAYLVNNHIDEIDISNNTELEEFI